MSDDQQPAPVPAGRNVNAKLVVAVVVAVVLILFAVLNTDDANVDFIVDSVNAPLIIVILVSALLGMMLDALVRLRARRRP